MRLSSIPSGNEIPRARTSGTLRCPDSSLSVLLEVRDPLLLLLLLLLPRVALGVPGADLWAQSESERLELKVSAVSAKMKNE